MPDEVVKATLPHLNGHLQAMVQVQELAAMRPQDIRNMRTGDIDMTGDVWIYKPWTHRNEHHGQVREIAIGPRAQAILKAFLKADAPLAYVFSPKDAVTAVRERRARERQSKRTPSQLARKPKPSPKRQPRDQYDKTRTRGRSRGPSSKPECRRGTRTSFGTTPPRRSASSTALREPWPSWATSTAW